MMILFFVFASASLTAVCMFADGEIDSSNRIIQVEKAIHLFPFRHIDERMVEQWQSGLN